MSKVILSFPYSGAIQEFFAKELAGNSFGQNHSYYRTLWGNNSEEISRLSLTLFTLYDEVIFSPVDNPLPDSNSFWLDEEYYHPDLGLRMPSRPSSIGIDYIEHQSYIDWVLTDPVIVRVLTNIPKHAKKQILFQVVCDVELSLRYGAEVISSNGRRLIMRRLCEIDPQYHNVSKNIVNFSDPIMHSAVLIVPDFEISSIDLLHHIKQDKDTRKYGAKVTSILKTNASQSKNYFYELALESNLKNSRHQTVNRFATLAGKVCSVLGFTPIVGPMFSAAALGLGESERLTNLSNSSWIEFKPHLSVLKTRFEIENELKQHINNKI
ncbi:hypothetical protein [Pluralibacter gergoviae]|uniref:hypothetical protein n=1 Tax=Pluralibacter gergoviae TaxID=61647 RepID=UPI000AC05DF4|nr:hypothetical protein [Pluralibacter gergoviae]